MQLQILMHMIAKDMNILFYGLVVFNCILYFLFGKANLGCLINVD